MTEIIIEIINRTTALPPFTSPTEGDWSEIESLRTFHNYILD